MVEGKSLTLAKLAELIAEKGKTLGFAQRELCAEAEVPLSTVSMMKSGRLVKIEWMEKLVDLVKLDRSLIPTDCYEREKEINRQNEEIALARLGRKTVVEIEAPILVPTVLVVEPITLESILVHLPKLDQKDLDQILDAIYDLNPPEDIISVGKEKSIEETAIESLERTKDLINLFATRIISLAGKKQATAEKIVKSTLVHLTTISKLIKRISQNSAAN